MPSKFRSFAIPALLAALALQLILLAKVFAAPVFVGPAPQPAIQSGGQSGAQPTPPSNPGAYREGFITAVGVGAAPQNAYNSAQARALAQRAAVIDARRKLLETIKGMRIASATSMKNYQVEGDAVDSRLSGLLEHSQVVETVFKPDGTAEATVAVNLRGPADAMPQTVKTIPFYSPTSRERLSPSKPAPIPGEDVVLDLDAPAYARTAELAPSLVAGHTGVIVDARGLDVRPSLSPRILDEAGNELYGQNVVGPDYAVEQGMVGYASDPGQAAQNPRVSGNPIVVKAKDVAGKARGDVVLDDRDAEYVKQSLRGENYLAKSRVMFVVD